MVTSSGDGVINLHDKGRRLIEITVYFIGILILGLDFNNTGKSFFTSVFLLIFPMVIKYIDDVTINECDKSVLKKYKVMKKIACFLHIIVTIICVLNFFGIIVVKFDNELSGLKMCIPENYVFLSGEGIPLSSMFILLFSGFAVETVCTFMLKTPQEAEFEKKILVENKK